MSLGQAWGMQGSRQLKCGLPDWHVHMCLIHIPESRLRPGIAWKLNPSTQRLDNNKNQVFRGHWTDGRMIVECRGIFFEGRKGQKR